MPGIWPTCFQDGSYPALRYTGWLPVWRHMPLRLWWLRCGFVEFHAGNCFRLAKRAFRCFSGTVIIQLAAHGHELHIRPDMGGALKVFFLRPWRLSFLWQSFPAPFDRFPERVLVGGGIFPTRGSGFQEDAAVQLLFMSL